MSQPTYNHMYSIAFEIPGSTDPHGRDLTPQQIHDALVRRAKEALENNELIEAVGAPHDSYEEESSDLKSVPPRLQP